MSGSAVTPSPRVVMAALWLSMTFAMSFLIGGHDLMGLGGLTFGGAALWFVDRREQQRNEDFAIGRLTRDRRVAVNRAVATGIAPTDPWLHEAALELARLRLAKTVRGHPLAAIALICLLMIVSVFYAVTDPSLYHALSLVLFGLTLALSAADLTWRRRRVARLEQTIDQLARPAYL